jgi:anti-sigma B factor antagonist
MSSDLLQPGSIAFAIDQRELDASTTFFAIEGELVLESAPSLKWALADALNAGYTQVVLDFSRVTFIDSTALGVLICARRSLDTPGRLAIACASPKVLRIFEITGLDAIFDTFPTVEAAIERVQAVEAS